MRKLLGEGQIGKSAQIDECLQGERSYSALQRPLRSLVDLVHSPDAGGARGKLRPPRI